ncbi:TRAP transporter permease [Sporolituus thermophilus]|uniref:TRAP transporter, 4TM/12TM fusion protein n=1 Tax=Sporolituus thermophilus DSM 23256 TaxID=1123285 RepID=A0A1G7I6H5_9FIRM|nr:TRAP transporter permease [Sporolituus thermophilus]SDF08054.1 TRAP transporter, 4TM/12TM fusion protein [Sporolituus thermophilus DSM 23256]
MTDHEVKKHAGPPEPEVSAVEVEELLKKVDKESTYRKLEGIPRKLVFWLAVAFSCFHLYTGIFGMLAAQLQRSIHLAFAFVLVFLLYPARKTSSNKVGIIDYITAVVAGAVGMYITFNYERLMTAAGNYSQADLIVGSLGVLFTLEAARRVVGLPIVVIASSFLIYAYVGDYLPGFLSHRGYSIERIVTHMYFTTEGILGIPLGVSATFIFLFLLFGAFLEKTGIGKFFVDIANALAGWASGGPAKVAVLTSGLHGMITGSSVANCVTCGTFTIPMMKKLGYRPEFAGAVEAAASTGGQIMPPVMGAAAFLMAEFTGIPYIEIAKAAFIPACLYFLGIWIEVHFEAKRLGLKGIDRSELPRVWTVMRERGHLIIPLFGIVYFLMSGYTPARAALAAIALSIIVGMLKSETRINFTDFLNALEAGARSALGVAIACATAGIIVGTVTLTGVGLKLANGLVALAGGSLLLTMVFTMIASLILGMGAPTTANYVITSTIAAPALVALGVPLLAAHMFVFYFGIVADITPPVALAAYAGSGIARSNPFRTGVIATKLAIAAFIIPYVFVYSPQLLLIKSTIAGVALNFLTASIGMIGVGAAMIGYFMANMNVIERIWFLIGGLMLIDPGSTTDIIGFVMLASGLFLQWRKSKANKREFSASA